MASFRFASPVLSITVSINNTHFYVHEALLRQWTIFFQLHTTRNGRTIKKAKQRTSEEPVRVKNEESSAALIEIPESGTTAADENVESEVSVHVDYHLETRFDEAFAILFQWLYNTNPKAPKNSKECRTLIQTYLIAQCYGAPGLQNLVLDRIRAYHSGHTVEFDYLFIYLLNRLGGDQDCRLVTYFVDQIAYEIADAGIDDFDSNNMGFRNFLTTRSAGNVRTTLFFELGRICQAKTRGCNVVDPATANGAERGYYEKQEIDEDAHE